MKISLNIEYRTNWGEDVRALGTIPELGNGKPENAVPLQTRDGIHWFVTVNLAVPAAGKILYTYYIYRDNKPVRKEWNNIPHSIFVSSDQEKAYEVVDSWRNLPEQGYFYSSAFTESLFARHRQAVPGKSYRRGLVIKSFSPRIERNYCLGICGNQKILGNWDAGKAVLMNDCNYPEWQTELDACKISFPLEYKFVLYNLKEEKVEAWETNPNRYLAKPRMEKNETIVVSDRYAYFDTPQWKGAGVAIPVFALKSEKSFGVGDFGDLKMLIDWAESTSQQIVQVLPVNDTTITHTWMDSYPYNSLSIYALHPMYTDIAQLGKLRDAKMNAYFAGKQKELNAYPTVDYEKVNKIKWEYIHLIYKQEGEEILASEGFLQFFEANREWLEPYAAFSCLRDLYRTPDFRRWPEHSTFRKEEVHKLCSGQGADYGRIGIYFYTQYNLHRQLLAATAYARQKGVILKGDIPIGISRNSVEAWTEPHYFNLKGQAGAPPDDFSVNGQNWGFPTYNWDVMEKDGYRWWVKRFRKMAEYFDAYRIDHILGFFRIWEIPMNAVHGLLGQFVPSIPMSREEIETYGLCFNDRLFLRPYIREYFLQQIFGPHTDYVKQTFIRTTGEWETYEMRPEFDTQRKVEAYFEGKADEDSRWIRDGLYALVSNVLFIRDTKEPEKFHPRIGVQHEFIYRSLSQEEKAAFNRLYDMYYYHRHNDFWRDQAMKSLPKLTGCTRMLVCGEDLGMVPQSVYLVMNELQILSLEIERMPKNPGQEFGNTNEYPYASVCTVSTHDMPTLRGWWQEDGGQTQRYYNHILQHYGKAPGEASGAICEEVVRMQLGSRSMFAILAFQDWLSVDENLRNPDIGSERINIPSDPRHYWRYRMHITLEELMQAHPLNCKIREMITQTGRSRKQ